MMLEQLESRRLMAVTAYTSGWTLVVEGDSADNWISISRSNGIVWVNVYGGGGGYIPHFDEAHVDEIVLKGGGGSDILTIAQNITKPATIQGGAGADYLVGGGGYNDLTGHGAYDDPSDDGAADTLISGSGDSDLWGQDGHDALYTDVYATSGSDHMFGGDGNDKFYIRGKDSPAFISGDAGHDSMIPYQSATQHADFDGGSGNDNVNYQAWTAAIYVRPNGSDHSGLKNGTRRQTIGSDVEYIDGTNYNDHFSSTNSANIFYGHDGDDLMYGYGGNDTLYGQDGDDTIYAGSGNDLVSGGYGDDALYGDDGHDTIDGSYGMDDIHGGGGFDSLNGGNDTDYLYGDAGNDILIGGAGSDYIDSRDGVFGNDVIYGDYVNGTGATSPGGFLYSDAAYIDRFGMMSDLFVGLESVVW